MSSVLEEVSQVYNKAALSLNHIKKQNLLPDGKKIDSLQLPIGKVTEIVERTRQSVLNAEKNNIIKPRSINSATNRREGFTLEQVHALQAHFNTQPWRETNDDPIIIAVQNFKGGVGKSTQACSLAHYLATKGYRTLLVDQDSQGSTTATFGYLPDNDFEQDQTLFPFFYGSFNNEKPCQCINHAIRKTHWDSLDLIPANLLFYESEYVLASYLKDNSIEPLTLLHEGLQGVAKNYDVIILDAPPALGFISLNVLAAANAFIIPTPPALYDYMSTFQFLTMLFKLFKSGIIDNNRPFHFLKILPTRVESNDVETTLLEIMRQAYGEHLMKNVIPNSRYIKEASNLMTTIYEMASIPTPSSDNGKKSRPISSMTGYKNARKAMDAVNSEIESLILATRTSRIKKLIQEVSYE